MTSFTENYEQLKLNLAKYQDQCIPLDSVDIFWRKLDMSPLVHEENDDMTCDVELKLFKEAFYNQSKAGKKMYLEKLRGICDQSMPSVKEPIIQKNTRGRPTLKKQHQKRRANSVNQNSQKRRRSTKPNIVEYNFMDLKPSPSREPSYTNYFDPLMKEIPVVFHPYITNIQNVIGDGNCGFRSIPICLGLSEDQWAQIRHELLEELLQNQDQYKKVFHGDFNLIQQSLDFEGTSFAPQKNWLIMPDSGVLIAIRYRVIVHFLSKLESSTCFPLWEDHEEFQEYRAITIAHVHGCHYIKVQLEGEYPMPTMMTLLKHYKHSCVAEWESFYKERIKMYTQLLPRSSADVIDV
ncbi:hypothetical protein E3N88_29395 [Mikania micrantha]|uniref:OTU domain-containing protein n=1 Tax=Mikania micrantha TaxID=192012 RepID=A0A5N6MJE6_9ASTR|nr:hypothetical protein E3N88_29395 [Mikania micrantha]